MKRVCLFVELGLFAGLWMIGGTARAATPVNPNLIQNGRNVLNFLESQYGQRTVAGMNIYGQAPNSYQLIGRRGAIWMQDVKYADPQTFIPDCQKYAPILSFHWHWELGTGLEGGDAKGEEDVSKVITPGTAEYNMMINDLDALAERLQYYEDAGIPILWRPLHEIDNGHFWWTDTTEPENTARLWRIMYDYLTNTKGLNNLIWVYNGINKNDPAYRARFYPGSNYVDIASVDIYGGADMTISVETLWEYWDYLETVAPGKMKALGECAIMPNPEYMKSNTTPRWLYSPPWCGIPGGLGSIQPYYWGKYTYDHTQFITLDELSKLYNTNNDLVPEVGIISPHGNGKSWFYENSPVIDVMARDRDGSISYVEFWAINALTGTETNIGQDSSSPYQMVWQNAPAGIYKVYAKAVSSNGVVSDSRDMGQCWKWNNFVWITVGYEDLARFKNASASTMGSLAAKAVNGDTTDWWSSDKNDATPDDEWLAVDLGAEHSIDRMVLRWGWKIWADSFRIETATSMQGPWTSQPYSFIYTDSNDFGAVFVLGLSVNTRYIRFHGLARRSGQTWGGYSLAAIEIPRLVGNVGAPILTLDLNSGSDVFYARPDYGSPYSAKTTGSGFTYTPVYFSEEGEALVSEVSFQSNNNTFAYNLYDDAPKDLSLFSDGVLHFFARSSVGKTYQLFSRANGGDVKIMDLAVSNRWRQFVIPVSQMPSGIKTNLHLINRPFVIKKTGGTCKLYLKDVFWNETNAIPYTGNQNIWIDPGFSDNNNPFVVDRNITASYAGLSWVAGLYNTTSNCWVKDTANDRAGFVVPSNGNTTMNDLVQVVQDNRKTVAMRKLSFKVTNTDASSPANRLRVRLWGINGAFTFDMMSADVAPLNNGELVGDLLADRSIEGASLTNATVSVENIDMGIGYVFLAVQFTADNVDTTRGDVLWIDDVRLGMPENPPPAVSIVAPTNNAQYLSAPAAFTVKVSASDSDGIEKVEFYDGDTWRGTDTTVDGYGFYSLYMTNVSAGNHTINAKAHDVLGTTAVAQVNISVLNNAAPTVTLTSPSNGATFTAPAAINFAATASDGDGVVAKVQFLNNWTRVGEDASSPYTYSWTNVPAGTYTLRARAYDDTGAQGVSSSITVTVR